MRRGLGLYGLLLAVLRPCSVVQGLPLVNGTMWDHPGWACLRSPNSSLVLQYPDDAEAHFAAIHARLAEWSQPPGHQPHSHAGYQGPWVENVWISHARERYPAAAPSPPLAATFGPFVPLLINWVDAWAKHHHYPPALLQRLREVLRPTVPYVTVSQNDEGITGKCELLMKDWPNILVLSAGGFGHIAVPLLIREQPPQNTVPMTERKHLVSFVGSLHTTLDGFRERMHAIVMNASARLNFSAVHYHGPDWLEVMRQSRVSLTPRGYGRSSFHLTETVQMGLIPLHVYSDVPWVPYPALFDKFGYVTTLRRLPGVLQTLHHASPEALEQRERRVRRYRPLFLAGGFADQAFRYLLANDSALQCVGLPRTQRDHENNC